MKQLIIDPLKKNTKQNINIILKKDSIYHIKYIYHKLNNNMNAHN